MHRATAHAAATLLAAILASPASAGEEATIKAFSAMEGRGTITQTGAKQGTFVGALGGVLYVETEKGPVPAGQMLCPAMVQVDLDSGAQTGTGNCVIKGEKDAQIYAEMSCKGIHLIGCDGEMKLTGGTGRFEGVTGGGRFTLRSSTREMAGLSAATAAETMTGILIMPELRYQLP
jgi:hypothetical protein